MAPKALHSWRTTRLNGEYLAVNICFTIDNKYETVSPIYKPGYNTLHFREPGSERSRNMKGQMIEDNENGFIWLRDNGERLEFKLITLEDFRTKWKDRIIDFELLPDFKFDRQLWEWYERNT